MAIVKQQAGVLLAFLLLSQPVVAVRLQSKRQMQAVIADEQMESAESKWCWFSPSNALRHYYFEIQFPDQQEHSTMKLIRDPESPKLVISHKTRWVVRSPPANKSEDPLAHLPWERDFEHPDKMQWLARCFGCAEGDERVIELRNVTSIRKVHVNVTDPQTRKVEEEVGIDITFPDNTTESFIGGVYLPRSLMFAAMERALEENGKFNGLADEAKQSSSDKDNMIDAGQDKFKTGFTGGAVAGGSVGVGFGAFVLLMGIPSLGGFAASTMLAGAATGLLAGSSAGLALGAVFGTVVGGSAALWDYHKQKKELKLSGTEKIWSKMECHNWFRHCSSDLIVPYYSECPNA